MYFGRLSLLLLRRVDLRKYCPWELEVLLLDHSLLQKHWHLIILHSRYLSSSIVREIITWSGSGTAWSQIIFT